MKTLGSIVGLVVVFMAGLAIFIHPAFGGGDDGVPEHKVTICHHVEGNGNTGNGYDIETVDKDSISSNPNGHDGHALDIIPAFAAGFTTGPPPKQWNAYGGKNTDKVSWISNNCKAPDETTTGTTTTTTTTTDTTDTTTTTDTQPPCPSPGHGHDGNPGNDDCNPCDPPVDVKLCPPPNDSTTITTTTTPEPPTTTTDTTTTATEPTTTEETTTTPVAPNPKPQPPKKHNPPKKHHNKPPPVCPPGKSYSGKCGVQGSG